MAQQDQCELENVTRELIATYPCAFDVDKEGLIDMMLDQFDNPFLCYREIIQNSIDENSSKVKITIDYDEEQKLLDVSVEDDGDGMCLAKLRRYLTLFDSTKEDVLDTIGEMGAGKIFAFALEPELMVIETGTGQEGYKLTINDTMGGQIKKIKPRKGTKVKTIISKEKYEVRDFIQRIRDTIKETCSHVNTPLYINSRKINTPLDIDSEFKEYFKNGHSNGMLAFTGISNYKLLKGGIVLEEGYDLEIDYSCPFSGLELMIDSFRFDQPLSRNSVCRDEEFRDVIYLAKEALGRLVERILERYNHNMDAQESDYDTCAMRRFLLKRFADNYYALPDDITAAPLFLTANRHYVSYDKVMESASEEGRIYCSDEYFNSNELTYFTKKGIPVVKMDAEEVEEYFGRRYPAFDIESGLLIEGASRGFSRGSLTALESSFITAINSQYERLDMGDLSPKQSIRSAMTMCGPIYSGGSGESSNETSSMEWYKVRGLELGRFNDLNGNPREDLTLIYENSTRSVVLNSNDPYIKAMMQLSKVNPQLAQYYTLCEVANSKTVFPHASPKHIENFIIGLGQVLLEKNGKKL